MKFSLLLLLLAVSFIAQAQNWCPPGAVWAYNYYSMSANGYTTLTYEKDTVIAAQLCHKLTRVTRQNPGNTTFVGQPEFTLERNDTVFFYYADAFRPVYFFSAQLGDTISYYNGFPLLILCDSTYSLLVDSVGTTIINGETLRFYRTYNLAADTNGLIYPQKVTVIEKIGAVNNYLIPFYSCYTDGDYYDLRCYTDSTFGLYQTDTAVACDYLYMSVDKMEREIGISLYPIPSNNQINVTVAGTTITRYQILDYSGKEVLNNDADSDALNIDVSTLPQGIYLLKLELANGQYAVKRFLKN